MPAADADARLARFRVVAPQMISPIWRVTRQPLKHTRVAPPSRRSNANATHEADAARRATNPEAHAKRGSWGRAKSRGRARRSGFAAGVARDAAVSRLVRAASRNQRRVW